MRAFHDKIAVVTGGASGIGRAVCVVCPGFIETPILHGNFGSATEASRA